MFRPVLAYDISPGSVGLPTAFENLGDVISALLPAVVSLAGLACFAYLIYGGLRWLTSGGDPKAAGDAQKVITNAVIGLTIVFCSWWLIRIIEVVLGLEITGWP